MFVKEGMGKVSRKTREKTKGKGNRAGPLALESQKDDDGVVRSSQIKSRRKRMKVSQQDAV
jgi:hypothetical protein